MSTTITVKMDRNMYRKLQDFANQKHENFRCVSKELSQAVKEYLERQAQDPIKD